ncbi:MAG: hypothetical protein AB7O77_16120 [Phycisphaerales bacterium]
MSFIEAHCDGAGSGDRPGPGSGPGKTPARPAGREGAAVERAASARGEGRRVGRVNAARAGTAYLNVEEPVTLLIVSASATWQARLRAACLLLQIQPMACAGVSRLVSRLAERDRTGDESVPVIALDIGLGEGAVNEALSAAGRYGIDVVLLCERSGAEARGLGERCGSLDVLGSAAGEVELARRVGAGGGGARERARQNRRNTRLKRLCRRLCDAPRQVARQIDSLWTELLSTHRETGNNMNQVAISSEFGGLIRQELDLEVLLRTTLEYILSKSGPTNAAVFLPATTGDFTLGAYVNYDCPKETVDVLLDHMANVVAPRFEDVRDVAHLTDPTEIEEKVTGDAMWIGDSHIVAFACRHEGECLAIFLFFRDARSPYSDGFVEQLRVMKDLFGAQLARVVRIHHRHLPKEKWGALGDPPREENDDGLTM